MIEPANAQKESNTQPLLVAGRELMLECVTPNLGHPKANIWLWFKNDQPIEFSMIDNNNKLRLQNNESSSRSSLLSSQINGNLSSSGGDTRDDRSYFRSKRNHHDHEDGNEDENAATIGQPLSPNPQDAAPIPAATFGSNTSAEASRINLLQSGRYLYIPAIQLSHKGNYTCLAVNRLGSAQQQQQSANINVDNKIQEKIEHSESELELRDTTYQLRIARPPNLIERLPAKMYWPEPNNGGPANNDDNHQLELTCHVECEPLCHLEWFRNGVAIDFAQPANVNSLPSSVNLGPQQAQVNYQIKNMLFGENAETNKFRSLQSKLIIQYPPLSTMSNDQSMSAASQRGSRKTLLDKIRNGLSGSNFTCSSTANPLGPGVKSTGRLVIQCKYS